MTEPNEPKKETTRISFGPAAVENPSGPAPTAPDMVQPPLGEPSVRISTEPQSVSKPAVQEVMAPQFFQAPPSSAVPLSASVMPAPDLPASGLIKETVRIPLRSVQMKKTQPLVAMPEIVPDNPSIAVAPTDKNSMTALWLLLGVAALILIIQIWTYLS